jgi:hypothetical protein
MTLGPTRLAEAAMLILLMGRNVSREKLAVPPTGITYRSAARALRSEHLRANNKMPDKNQRSASTGLAGELRVSRSMSGEAGHLLR